MDFHTSDTVMRLAERPKSMIIIGGGYIAAEFAHVFSAFGTAVTVAEPLGRAAPARGRLILQSDSQSFSAGESMSGSTPA